MHRRAIVLTLLTAALAGAGGCKEKKKAAAVPAAGSGDEAGRALGPASPGNNIPRATDPDTGYEARRDLLLRRGNPEMMKDAPIATTTAPDIKKEQLIKVIGPDLLQVGPIKVDTKAGRVELPAKVTKLASDNAPLEYIAVAEGGKAYESLLTISANAIELRLALTLIGYEGASPAPDASVPEPSGEDTVLLAGIVGGKERPLSAYMIDRKTKKPPKDYPWQVIGFRPEDRDQALLTKDFFTLVERDNLAPLRYTLDGGNPYEGPTTGFTTNPKALPPPGGELTLVIKRGPEKTVLPAGLMTPTMTPDMPIPGPRTP